VLADYPTRQDLRDELAKLATKQDLEIWAGALEARLDAKLAAKIDHLRAELSTELRTQIAHFAKAIEESNRKLYLPERVARLEARND
jgi:hypothetical protein